MWHRSFSLCPIPHDQNRSRWHARCCMTCSDTGSQAKGLRSVFGAVASWGRGREPRAVGVRELHLHHAHASPAAAPQASSERDVRSSNTRSRERVGLVPDTQHSRTCQRGVRATREHQLAVSVSRGSLVVLEKNQIRPVNEAVRTVGFIPVTPRLLGKRQPKVADLTSTSLLAAFSIALETRDSCASTPLQHLDSAEPRVYLDAALACASSPLA